MHPTWNLDPTRFLTRRELAAVLSDAQAKAGSSLNSRRNLIIVRLACCCGLRVSEIADLQLDDVFVDVERPHLRLRREATKGHKTRCVPLWWDRAKGIFNREAKKFEPGEPIEKGLQNEMFTKLAEQIAKGEKKKGTKGPFGGLFVQITTSEGGKTITAVTLMSFGGAGEKKTDK